MCVGITLIRGLSLTFLNIIIFVVVRPESYLADVNTSEALSNGILWLLYCYYAYYLSVWFYSETARYQLFTDLASGAESGWDFSSRWFAADGPFPRQLASIRTTSIVPVDLNAILCSNEATLSWLHNITGMFQLFACDRTKCISLSQG